MCEKGREGGSAAQLLPTGIYAHEVEIQVRHQMREVTKVRDSSTLERVTCVDERTERETFVDDRTARRVVERVVEVFLAVISA